MLKMFRVYTAAKRRQKFNTGPKDPSSKPVNNKTSKHKLSWWRRNRNVNKGMR